MTNLSLWYDKLTNGRKGYIQRYKNRVKCSINVWFLDNRL